MEMSFYLLIGMLFVAILHVTISKEFVQKHTGKKGFMSVIKAALFGVPLPLCSCGVLPTAVFLKKNGSTKGAAISFLISTPQTGVDSMIATYGMMGWVFAIFRPIAAFVMGVVGGAIIDKTDTEEHTEQKDKVIEQPGAVCELDVTKLPWKEKFQRMWRYAFVEFFDDISVHFMVGVLIAGLITVIIPDNLASDLNIGSGIVAMLLMIAIGIPMYVCATSSIPIALALMMKGFSPGVAFVFLAMGPATNAASIAVIKKVFGAKTTLIFLGVLAVMGIIMGYLLDWIYAIGNFNIMDTMNHNHNHSMISPTIMLISAIIMSMLVIASFYRIYLSKYFRKTKNKEYIGMEEFKVTGMSCSHCASTIKDSVSKIEGVESAEIDFNNNLLYVKGKFERKKVIETIISLGYGAE
jgi:hypothetical protein